MQDQGQKLVTVGQVLLALAHVMATGARYFDERQKEFNFPKLRDELETELLAHAGVDGGAEIEAILVELGKARAKHPKAFNSAHEGYAVAKEELEEAWDEIKRDNLTAARKEVRQLGAMSLRFLLDLPEPNHG
jgi:hypothetical protein